MANKKGDKYQCEDCGLILMVDEPCGCEPCKIACCGTPMKPVAEKTKTSTAKPSSKTKK